MTNSLGKYLIAFCLTAIGVSQQGNFDTQVAQFFPQRLIDDSAAEAAQGGPQPYRDSAYVEADLDGTGSKDYVVAVYTNGVLGSVRVLKKVGNSLALVASPEFPAMLGSNPTIRAVDVDSDGRFEIVPSLLAARTNRSTWILRWSGTTLFSIGPAENDQAGQPDTLLGNVFFSDLEGDGRLEAINTPGSAGFAENEELSEFTYEVYRIANGVYSATPSRAPYFSPFRRITGPPRTENESFYLQSPVSGYRLRIVNGGLSGIRVASGTIKLNGVEVVSQNQLSQQVGYLTVPVTVQQNNTIEVTLGGTPLGGILVLVLPPE